MKRFMVVSGFLGAGKTTTMVALSEYINANLGKASIIANDLGARNLVDTKFSKAQGCDVTEITGGCICYQTENLVDRLRRLLDYEKNEFVMSDIPGCGVGALDLVYFKLNEDYHGEFELAPFTVVADPERLRTIMPEQADINLPKEMNCLFRSQLLEADVILLNKIDLLSEEQIREYRDFLQELCPEAEVFAISARERIGIDRAAEYIMSHNARLKPLDLDYGSQELMEAEEKLSWYNRQVYMRHCCAVFDGNAFVHDLVEAIRNRLKDHGRNVPHLKVYAEAADGTACKVSLLGVDYPVETDSLLKEEWPDLPVIINARAACESQLLLSVMDDALEEVGEKYQCSSIIFFTECFGMMDEGRI